MCRWQGSRYSVPWRLCGQRGVGARARPFVEVHYGGERIAVHASARDGTSHYAAASIIEGIPLGSKSRRQDSDSHSETAPVVEVRPLAAYESAAMGGAR